MSRLIPLADWTGERRASVVFVHGLGGHPYDTWRHTPDPAALWPLWLAEDIPGLAVWSLGYDSPPSNWIGTAMPILDQAANILRILLNEPALQHGPFAFVCHSLGGLLVKQVLRDANEQRADPPIASLLDRTCHVTFIATPHTGSGKATLLDRLRVLFRHSDAVRDLAANRPELRHLNLAYREIAQARGDSLRHLTFFETAPTWFGRIVDPAAADPALGRPRPIPIHRDHLAIAKPLDRGDDLYRSIVPVLSALAPLPATRGKLCVHKLPPFVADRWWHPLVQKLLGTAPRLNGQPQPAAEQQLAAAVENIAQGAAAGDTRLQQALALLAAGDTTEATRLLQTVADEKTARIKTDSADAARAYRNLGAIAGLADPRRALEAYLKAVELDPDDIDSLLWVGWIELQHGRLDQAEQRFRRILALPDTARDARNRYWARLGLGDIRVQRGDLALALADYRRPVPMSRVYCAGCRSGSATGFGAAWR